MNWLVGFHGSVPEGTGSGEMAFSAARLAGAATWVAPAYQTPGVPDVGAVMVVTDVVGSVALPTCHESTPVVGFWARKA